MGLQWNANKKMVKQQEATELSSTFHQLLFPHLEANNKLIKHFYSLSILWLKEEVKFLCAGIIVFLTIENMTYFRIILFKNNIQIFSTVVV